MPKVRASEQTKLNKLILEFGKDVFSSDGSVLFCKICDCKVNFEKKYFVSQHLSTVKHKNAASKNCDSKKTCLLPNFGVISNRQSQFSLDLCKALMDANIPLWKLENPSLKAFLEKYTKEHVPSESTLRKNYIDVVFQEKMNKIRKETEGKNLWVSIDETTDALGRYVANVIIGTLQSTHQDSNTYLLTSEVLESANNSTIAQLFTSALSLLWPDGVKHDKVLLFVSDAAPYMKAAGKVLQVLFPKMVHVTCIAHALHRVAEEARSLFHDVDLLISNVKKVFLKAPSRVQIFKELAPDLPLPPQPTITRWGTWISAAIYYATHFEKIVEIVDHLENDAASIKICKDVLSKKNIQSDLAYILAHFHSIPTSIQKLEERNLKLQEQLNIMDETIERINSAPGLKGEFMKEKCEKVLQNNSGLVKMREINSILLGDGVSNFLNPTEISSFMYAPLTSVDVERSFSLYKHILSDRRQSIKFENLRKLLVVMFNKE